MIKLPTRICLCAKDIMRITGKSERTARRLMAAIRKQQLPVPYSLITITAFCAYTGLTEAEIEAFIK